MLRATVLAAGLIAVQPAGQLLTLEFRVYRASEEVTARTRVTVHRAGDRARPVAVLKPGEVHATKIPPGIYDAQVIEEQHGRVVNIRWAERLVVMPYPDEAGHHLEVVNFAPGFGALQIKTADPAARLDEVALYRPGDRGGAAATSPGTVPYVLFVVEAGAYDLLVKRRARPDWHPGIEVPLDRTRLWIVP